MSALQVQLPQSRPQNVSIRQWQSLSVLFFLSFFLSFLFLFQGVCNVQKPLQYTRNKYFFLDSLIELYYLFHFLFIRFSFCIQSIVYIVAVSLLSKCNELSSFLNRMKNNAGTQRIERKLKRRTLSHNSLTGHYSYYRYIYIVVKKKIYCVALLYELSLSVYVLL